MMYRRSAAQTPRRDTLANIARGAIGAIGSMISRVLGWTDVYDQAWRENRRWTRYHNRENRSQFYRGGGATNQKRECDRRKRQIAAGQLTVCNGLVRTFEKVQKPRIVAGRPVTDTWRVAS